MRLTAILPLLLLALPSAAGADVVPVPAADAAYQAGDYAKAAKLWGEACSAGNATGCYELAIMYRDGEGLKPDPSKVRSLYEQACTGGQGSGCYNLGNLYMRGDGVSRDPTRAMGYWQRGCDVKTMQACGNLAHAYLIGDGVAKDVARGTALMSTACDGGAGAACFSLSALFDGHEEGVVREDPTLANAALAKGCDLGNSESCQNLGYHYRIGYGVSRNKVRSASLYSAACSDATSANCMMLSREWFTADVARYAATDVRGEYRDVAGIYQAACDDRFAQGCLSLASLVWRTGTNCTQQRDRILDLNNRALAINPAYPLAVKFLARIKNGDCPRSPL